jgi:hypothetical protein
MCEQARSALWFISLIHCGFAIYIFGNQDIFYNPDERSKADLISDENKTYFSIISKLSNKMDL